MSTPEIAISLPFSFDSFGNVLTTIDQEKMWADRVFSVIGTAIGERVMRGDFGSEIRRTLFDTQSSMEVKVDETINTAFNNHLPLLTLGGVTHTRDASNNIMTVSITYALPNKNVVTTTIPVTAGKISISGNSLPKEVI